MLFQGMHDTLFWTLITAGLIVSALSGLERRVQWIADFCAWFGEGCQRTEKFTLLHIPIFVWGLVFYGAVALLFTAVKPLVFWAVAAGFGAELTFLWIMLRLRVFCIFCLLNGVVVLLLFAVELDPERSWQALATALLVFVASNALLQRENREEMGSGAPAPVGTGDAPALGPADAAVTVVEYSDYLCPACRSVHEVAGRIKEQYEGRIRWVFKDFPLKRHRGAFKMAEAAHCADEQGLFWAYQDAMFRMEEAPDTEGLIAQAGNLGADADAFRACLESGRQRGRVNRGIEDGRRSGVSATPTFFVNGRMTCGALSEEAFQGMIDEALKT